MAEPNREPTNDGDQNQEMRGLTFDEILRADAAYQSEFDRRVQKALDTAKTK